MYLERGLVARQRIASANATHKITLQLDHSVGATHSARPKSTDSYYNATQTYLGLRKDTQKHRPVERRGTIVSCDILGGLHRQYCRI